MTVNNEEHFEPEHTTQDGRQRRVGIEIELAGLTPDLICENLQTLFGGRIETESVCVHFVKDSCFGDFRIELDAGYLKDLAEFVNIDTQNADQESIMDAAAQKSADTLFKIAETFVPWEIVSPPLPFSELERFNQLIPRLREAGGLGTSDSVRYAFGVHLNPELPDLKAETIVRYLKAFFCTYDWICEQENIDGGRKTSPYINHFDKEYIKLVLSAGYQPDRSQLIADYLKFNPTRNRSLDMLPLFAELDEDNVEAVVDDSRVKPRPTFHYRLPNCDLDNPDWDLFTCWDNWLVVEQLAMDPELQNLCDDYLIQLNRLLPLPKSLWIEHIEEYLPEAA